MPSSASSEADRIAVAFARVLRGAGLDVPVGSTLLFAEALVAVGLDNRSEVYWAGCATLLRRPEDADTYDRAFDAFWFGISREQPADDAEISVVTIGIDDDISGDGDPSEESTDEPQIRVRWSPAEILRNRDFATYTHAEHAEARRLMADVRLAARCAGRVVTGR